MLHCLHNESQICCRIIDNLHRGVFVIRWHLAWITATFLLRIESKPGILAGEGNFLPLPLTTLQCKLYAALHQITLYIQYSSQTNLTILGNFYGEWGVQLSQVIIVVASLYPNEYIFIKCGQASQTGEVVFAYLSLFMWPLIYLQLLLRCYFKKKST